MEVIQMFIPGKIASITLSTILGISGLGVANAALSPDSQQEGMKNQTPVVSTDISQPSDIKTMQDNTKPDSIVTGTISPEQKAKLHDNWLDVTDHGLKTEKGDIYEKMVQKDQQLMQHINHEQMIELDREWMEQTETLHQKWEMLVKNSSGEDHNDRYERMNQIDQQMMKDVTPEHFRQLNTAWMKQFNNQHHMSTSTSKQAAPASNAQKNMKTQATTSSSMNKQEKNKNTQDINLHSNHYDTNKNHTRTHINHQSNMKQDRHNWAHNYQDHHNMGQN